LSPVGAFSNNDEIRFLLDQLPNASPGRGLVIDNHRPDFRFTRHGD
jgi:hypothetical protein